MKTNDELTKESQELLARAKIYTSLGGRRYVEWIIAVERPHRFLCWTWTEKENILQVDHVPVVFASKSDALKALAEIRGAVRFGYDWNFSLR